MKINKIKKKTKKKDLHDGNTIHRIFPRNNVIYS